MKTARNGKDQGASIPLAEWLMGSVGLLLTLGLLAYLGYQKVVSVSGPPDIAVEVRESLQSGEDYLVVFEARNQGYGPAADVLIEGEIRLDGEVVEISQASLNYIPARSSREGGLFFTRDPAGHTLSIRALGYTRP